MGWALADSGVGCAEQKTYGDVRRCPASMEQPENNPACIQHMKIHSMYTYLCDSCITARSSCKAVMAIQGAEDGHGARSTVSYTAAGPPMSPTGDARAVAVAFSDAEADTDSEADREEESDAAEEDKTHAGGCRLA